MPAERPAAMKGFSNTLRVSGCTTFGWTRKASWMHLLCSDTYNRGAKLSAEVDPIGELRTPTAIGSPSVSRVTSLTALAPHCP